MGFGGSMERAIVNSRQRSIERKLPYSVRYDPMWAWDQSKLADEWSDTNPGDDNGTSVRAFYDVMRTQGHRLIRTDGIVLGPNGVPVVKDVSKKPAVEHGVKENRWATTVDEIRTAIANGLAVTIGVTWYANFDTPVLRATHYWIGLSLDLGRIRGGHCACIYGASDTRQAFRMKNSWGKSYPLVWIPYTVMQKLLDDYGEACLVVDR